jgi:Polyketide cyclase / dehydrase and lipid transport
MFPCQRVGLDLIETARFRSTNSVDLKITPGQLWQVLEEAESWPKWSYVKHMIWRSPKPFRVGTTRAVETRSGGRVIDEVIVWHPQVHLAFRVNEVSEPPGGGSVEELRIEPTPQGCRLTWTLAHDPKNPPLMARIFAKRVMNLKYRQYLTKLRHYTDQRFGMTI